MHLFRPASISCVLAVLVGAAAFGQDAAIVDTPPSLAGVTWAGPAPAPSLLKGKTVVVLTYVTWCPTCNAWTGKVAAELEQLEKLSTSVSIADKLSAVDKATFVTSQFPSTPEGRRAKDLLAQLVKDSAIKDEVIAKKQYDAAMKIADPIRRRKSLESLVKKYAETEYG